MAHSADEAAIVESFQAAARSIVDLSINREVTREALAKSPRTGLRKLAGRLFYGVRQLIDIAEGERTTALLAGGLSDALKRIAVKAGASIIVDAIVPLIPLGWLSLVGFAVRPIIRRVLYWAVDLGVDVAINWRKGDI